MLKSIQTILKQDKEMFVVPRRVQDLIPVQRIWPDGIFQVGPNKFSKTWKFSDINYQVASEEDKENMFLLYSDVLNSFDSAATTKITVNNHRLNKKDFESSILMPMKNDGLDEYREEYNAMLLEKATGANGIRIPFMRIAREQSRAVLVMQHNSLRYDSTQSISCCS